MFSVRWLVTSVQILQTESERYGSYSQSPEHYTFVCWETDSYEFASPEYIADCIENSGSEVRLKYVEFVPGILASA